MAGESGLTNYARHLDQLKKTRGPLGLTYTGARARAASQHSGSVLTLEEHTEWPKVDHPENVGPYHRYIVCGPTPIYHLGEIKYPKGKPHETDLLKNLWAYAAAYRSLRKKWWGWKDVDPELPVPYDGMKDQPFKFCRGGWHNLSPTAWFGAGGCGDWQEEICAALPKNSYRNGGYHVHCHAFPGMHMSAFICLNLLDKEAKPGNPLYDKRKEYVVMLDPWITGCCCIYPLAGWKNLLTFTGELNPGMETWR